MVKVDRSKCQMKDVGEYRSADSRPIADGGSSSAALLSPFKLSLLQANIGWERCRLCSAGRDHSTSVHS
jgi:hypothetical protein